MNITKMNRRVELLQYVAGEDHGFGAVGEWKTVATVWAQVHTPKIAVGVEAGSASAVVLTQGITIRPRKDIAKGWRIKLNGDLYDVLHVDVSQKDCYTLTCRAAEVQS